MVKVRVAANQGQIVLKRKRRNPKVIFGNGMTLLTQVVFLASAKRWSTAVSLATSAMMMLVSSRYLPLMCVNLLAVGFNGLVHQVQVIRWNGTGEAKQLPTGDTWAGMGHQIQVMLVLFRRQQHGNGAIVGIHHVARAALAENLGHVRPGWPNGQGRWRRVENEVGDLLMNPERDAGFLAYTLPPRYEVAEIVNLQALRDAARQKRV